MALKALVVFHDHGNHWLDPLLKPGFRHCFVAVAADPYWVEVDGRAGVPVVRVVAGIDFDMAQFYREQGFAVLHTEQSAAPPRGPLALANCVGLVKAVLGLSAPWTLTPYQLYRRIINDVDFAGRVDLQPVDAFAAAPATARPDAARSSAG